MTVFDISRYGARETNSSEDNDIAIQNALADLISEGRGIFAMPAGEYDYSQTISCPTSKVIFEGEGDGTSLNYKGSGIAMQLGSKVGPTTTRVKARDFKLTGTPAAKAGLNLVGLLYSKLDSPCIQNFNGPGAYGLILDTKSEAPYLATNTLETQGGFISNCYNGIKITKDPANPGTYGSNHSTFIGTRVASFTGIGIDNDAGENNNFFGCDASTSKNNAVCVRINDSVTGLYQIRADCSFGPGNSTVGILVTKDATDFVIIQPTGNGPGTRIKYENPSITGQTVRNSFNRWYGAVDFDRRPTIKGVPL
jgi:hypothetical protein